MEDLSGTKTNRWRIGRLHGIVLSLILITFGPVSAGAGTYLGSSHGNVAYGVNRGDMASAGYSRGNCAHCHEQHASVGGTEPAPAGGPSAYSLFSAPYTSQTQGLCLECHTDSGSRQSQGYIVNRSYSYRAGGWTSDLLDDVREAFSFVSPGSSHNLGDIRNFLLGRWGYNSESSPCVGCHNPHAAQGDPANDVSGTKTPLLANRGWPVSRPSQHGDPVWPLWGDDVSERLSAYTTSYQAPFRFGSTVAYEPDGSSVTDGSNLTDFNTFCTDCHSASNVIYSTTLGRDLRKIDWSQDKHGTAFADEDIDMVAPYSDLLGRVLSCTDCHEPHGSPNSFLIRAEVNGAVLAGTVDSGVNAMGYLCRNCHQDDASAQGGSVNKWEWAHHKSPDRPYLQQMCGSCHSFGGPSPPPIACTNCHFHGSRVNDPANPLDVTPSYSPTTRTTF